MTAEEQVAKGYIKVSSCAQVIEGDAATVYRLRDRGVLKGLNIDGAHFIQIESLKKYMESRRTALATAHATQGTEN